jgi:hypothetical protein
VRIFGACHSSTARSAWRGCWARRLGIVLSDHTEDDGAAIFQQAYKMNLEGKLYRLRRGWRHGARG